MKIVGEQLESWAGSQASNPNKDLFARSAFNRYYYAAYLVTREMLGEYEPSWKSTPHKNIPNLLEKTLKKIISTELKKIYKKGQITHGERQKTLSAISYATSDLSNLLRVAYDVRVTADYDPELLVENAGGTLILGIQKLSSANCWSDRTNSYCKIIRKILRDLGLV